MEELMEDISQLSDEEFIRNIAVKLYQGASNQRFAFAIFDLSGRIMSASRVYAKYFACDNPEELYGETVLSIAKKLIAKRSIDRPTPMAHSVYYEMVKEWERLRQKVIQTEDVVSYINVAPFPQGTIIFQAYHLPIWNPSGKIVGTKTVSGNNNVFHDNILLRNRFIKKKAFSNKDIVNNLPELTSLEYKIILLLSLGLSQNNVASLLNIARGTIANTISERICPKFGLHGANTKLLISLLMEIEYFNHMPYDMIPPILIETNI